MRSLLRVSWLVVLAAGCVEDVVLPDQVASSECGNGLVEPGEGCDVASPGCVACEVAPTWTCTPEGCRSKCGDGVIGSGDACSAPRRESDCSMTGYWAAREAQYLREPILSGLQVSSNWYFFRVEQEGDEFRVREALDCGILVTGSATVRYTPESLRSIIHANRMDGGGERPPRGGTSRAVPGGCAVSFDRWYSVRGASEAFLPADFSAKPALSALPALPSVKDPLSMAESPAGATDPDGDGVPGLSFQIAGLASGIRNAAQRDWKEFVTPDGASVQAGSLSFLVPGSFDLQENVLRVTECGTSCGLLMSVARIAPDLAPRIEFAYVGKDLHGERVSEVAKNAPRTNVEDDLATCANVRLLLPHNPAAP